MTKYKSDRERILITLTY